MKKNKLRFKYGNLIRKIFLLVCVGLFAYSSYNIYTWLKNSRDTKKQIETINKDTDVKVIKDNEKVTFVDTDPDYYRLYKDVDLIAVDFEELFLTNKDTKGWIKVNNTNINYPYVQAKDNKYYLNHTYNKKANGGGWVYLDYRNNPNMEDINTIIYGHGRKDKTIFGTLGNVLNKGYIDKKENQFIMISTPTKNLTYQIFSAYKIPNTSDYIKTDFSSEKEIELFFNMLKDRNKINIDVSITPKDKILTLSTCYNNDIKIVVHAKLVKYMERWYNTNDLRRRTWKFIKRNYQKV